MSHSTNNKYWGKDFTPASYKNLLETLLRANFLFITFEEYCTHKPDKKHIILRHDVDLLPARSLVLAEIEHKLGIKATYYFRIVAESNQPKFIREIAKLGHEIAYHYEDLTMAKGDVDIAYKNYKENLDYFRQYYDVKTISMHGNPASKYDNRNIWKTFDYHKFNIIGEPYFDFINNEINSLEGNKFYFTDTGRMWNGDKYNVRDKAFSNSHHKKASVHTTQELAHFLSNHSNVHSVMINTHPQRWIDNNFAWWKEYVLQTLKNIIKAVIVKRNK